MHSSDLDVGRVCYWQDGGWHGCNVIIKISKRFVFYKRYSDCKIVGDMTRQSIKKFLKEHQIYDFDCEYGSMHKNIGKIIEI